jgi:solute:Na+ symporter, SSS family
MSLLDWLIVIIPVSFVIGMGYYSRRYVRSVADFLSAGRVCGRYVICASDVANALSIITLVAYVESHYKTGFAIGFWMRVIGPIGMAVALSGYCIYRFRETKSMSLGQFLEMRYNRPFRIFAAALRSFSEILANSIMPAIAARFFIYFLDLPHHVNFFGWQMPVFLLIILICLTLAISIICMGGTLAMVITDAIQGMFCFPLIVVFIFFILYTFSWQNEIVPVMMDRAQGESFINPYDISNLRDFNLFFVVILVFNSIFHRASWIGAGLSSAAKNPHEQKMASILGAWRGQISIIFYVLIGLTIITVMNHRRFSSESKEIRDNVSSHISQELIDNPAQRAAFNQAIKAVPAKEHQIGVDKPLSDKHNLDTPVLDVAHKQLLAINGEVQGNAKFQQYRTLFHQEMLASSMRQLLPTGLLGLFMLLMVLAMISTDNTRIYSAAVTVTQDVILPLKKKPFSLKQHVWALRFVSISIGVIFLIGSSYLSQLDYINLFVMIMVSMWIGGCAPVMIFGLYSRFGTTAGAFTSLITGMFLSLGVIFVKRNWADIVYPWLEDNGYVEPVANFLTYVSSPFDPWIVWEMNPVKFPINSYEVFFVISLITLSLYCIVSFLTMKEPFNLDRMLHRGKYNVDGEHIEVKKKMSFHSVLGKVVGISKEYSTGDKVIAWAFFVQSFVWSFLCTFLGVIIWNYFTPWPVEYWGTYFYVVFMIVPLCLAIISVFWFGIGGIIDLFRMFRDLKQRTVNPLDDGRVDGHVSVSDKDKFEKVEHEKDNSEEAPKEEEK